MRILSWNVNGLRACVRKGFHDFLDSSGADVIGLQEVRAFEHQLEPRTRAPQGWHAAFSPAERPGYSGVAIYSRQRPSRVETALGEPRFDAEGRMIIAHFGRMAVASVYFPKGSGRNRDNSRVAYKLDFYAAVFDRIQVLRRRGPVYVRRRLQHGPRGDRPGAAQVQQESQRIPARRNGRKSPDGWRRAGWIRSAPAIPEHRTTTPGGGNGAAQGSGTWAGGSTTCWPRPAPTSASPMRLSGLMSLAPTIVRWEVDLA